MRAWKGLESNVSTTASNAIGIATTRQLSLLGIWSLRIVFSCESTKERDEEEG